MSEGSVGRVRVYLIGSGPGDPGLMTVRGMELLGRADVVVHDYLANPSLLAQAPRSAERVYVGKKGFSQHVTQDQINALLVEKARELSARLAGAPDPDRVGVIVRLKGGDPFVFGRGGEEALALREAGVDFEVVPGVTSGIAAPAYAGIPVTQRGVASSVTFVTGNEDPTKDESAVAWEALADLAGKGATLCFYMGMRNLGQICRQLTGRGVDGSTPVALVRWGTTPDQRTLVTTLSDAVDDATRAGMQAPVMIIVGPVVGLRQRLGSWFERRPLLGRRVVVTRSRAQASELSSRLRELGAEVLEFPTIEQVEPQSYEGLDAALGRLDSYDWVVFTSANGVAPFFDRLAASAEGRPRDARALRSCRVAAIGPATAQALRSHGIEPDVVPDRYVAEAVFERLSAAGDLRGTRVLIPRAQVARETLPEMLRAAGASVDVVTAYRTQVPADAGARAGRLAEMLEAREVDAVTFTSSSTARNLASNLGGGAATPPGQGQSPTEAARLLARSGAKLFAIGPVTSKTLLDLGMPSPVEARTYTIPGLVDAIVGEFGRDRATR